VLCSELTQTGQTHTQDLLSAQILAFGNVWQNKNQSMEGALCSKWNNFDIYPTAPCTILYCSSGTEHSFANKWPILMGLAAVCACLNLDNDEDMCIYKVSFFGVEPYLYGYKILHGL
jgi:hypothetical protein